MTPCAVFNSRPKALLAALASTLALGGGCAPKLPAADTVLKIVAAVHLIPAAEARKPAQKLSLVWTRHRDGDDRVLIRDVAGVARGVLEINADGAVLRTANGVLRKKNADLIARELFGVSLPVRSLRYWLAATSDPGAKTRETVYSDGAMKEIVQHGVTVFFEEYDDRARPRKIRLSAPQGEVVIVIRQWLKAP